MANKTMFGDMQSLKTSKFMNKF